MTARIPRRPSRAHPLALVVAALALTVAVAFGAPTARPASAAPPAGTIDSWLAFWADGVVGGVAIDPDGNRYVSFPTRHTILRVAPDGTITRFAGTGYPTDNGDGGLADETSLAAPQALALGADGSLLVAEHGRIRRISLTTGRVSTVAGTGVAGFGGDGGPATSAQVAYPQGLAVGVDGAIYVADTGNSRVRRITRAGTITTVVGSGVYGSSGNGGPATAAALRTPSGVALQGTHLIVADRNNHEVRRVGDDGIIRAFAGNGLAGSTGDGRDPTSARLDQPSQVAVATDGSVLISDTMGNRVRRVAPGGPITTLAGDGRPASDGDDGPATAAALRRPTTLAIDPAGNLVVTSEERVRVVQLATGEQHLVAAAYDDFLDRHPRPGELTVYGDELADGLSRSSFVSTLSRSSEYTSAVVQRFYRDTLGRDGDPAGVAYWSGLLASGRRTVAEVAASFYASPEYFATYGPSGGLPAWVTGLYATLLGRSTDPAGRDYWVARAEARGRTDVAHALYQSGETRTRRVEALYTDLLARAPEPAGRAFWVGRIATTGDLALAASLAASPEYLARAQTRFFG